MSACTDLQIVGAAQAVVNRLEELYTGTGAKHPNSLRNKVNDELRELYETQGVDRQRITLNGEVIGVLSAAVSKPSEALELSIDDACELADWLQGTREGRGVLHALLNDGRARACVTKALQKHFDLQGELPGGCTVELRRYPAEWGAPRLRVDNEAMTRAVGGLERAIHVLARASGEVEE